MKKFRFRLEKVLSYRETLRDEKKTELMRVNNKLRELEDEQEANRRELGRVQADSDTVASFELARLYRVRLRSRLAELTEEIAVVNEERLVAMEAYMEAERDVKALLKLKERKVEEYDRELSSYEQKLLDEFSSRKDIVDSSFS